MARVFITGSSDGLGRMAAQLLRNGSSNVGPCSSTTSLPEVAAKLVRD